MTTATLEQAQRLVDKLSPLEQVHLLEYLTPRIVRTFATRQASARAANDATLADAWQAFFRIGDGCFCQTTREPPCHRPQLALARLALQPFPKTTRLSAGELQDVRFVRLTARWPNYVLGDIYLPKI